MQKQGFPLVYAPMITLIHYYMRVEVVFFVLLTFYSRHPSGYNVQLCQLGGGGGGGVFV